MKHQKPVVQSEGPGINDIAAKVVRSVAARNPLTAAIFEECEGEINSYLKDALGNQKPDFQKLHEVGSRAYRIASNAAMKKAMGLKA